MSCARHVNRARWVRPARTLRVAVVDGNTEVVAGENPAVMIKTLVDKQNK